MPAGLLLLVVLYVVLMTVYHVMYCNVTSLWKFAVIILALKSWCRMIFGMAVAGPVNLEHLTHFMPLISFDIPRKHQKTRGFLTISRGIEMKNWPKMSWRKWNWDYGQIDPIFWYAVPRKDFWMVFPYYLGWNFEQNAQKKEANFESQARWR